MDAIFAAQRVQGEKLITEEKVVVTFSKEGYVKRTPLRPMASDDDYNGAILFLAAALTVATVVRLALHARRDEIEIMQLVGAPTAYIRGPFVMEGVLQGGIGATVALVLLLITFLALRGRYLTPLAAAINLSSVRFLSPGLCLVLLVGGMLVGCLGGLVASRKA